MNEDLKEITELLKIAKREVVKIHLLKLNDELVQKRYKMHIVLEQ